MPTGVVAFHPRACPAKGLGRRVLLDFDGVVLRNRRVAEVVERRSAEWIGKHMRIADTRSAHKMSMDTYSRFGHTVLIDGERIGRHDDVLQSYNDYVFDEETCVDLLPTLITVDDAIRTRKLLDIAEERSLEYVLCANPPLRYVSQVLESQGIDLQEVFPHYFFTSDILGTVKPMFEFFHNVEDILVAEDAPIHFIDDSSKNIRCASIMGWNALEIDNDEDLLHHLRSFPIGV